MHANVESAAGATAKTKTSDAPPPSVVVAETAAGHQDDGECGCIRFDDGECGCLEDRLARLGR